MTPAFDIVGLTVRELSAISGESHARTLSWLCRNGYTRQGGRIVRAKTLQEQEAELEARRSASGPSAPCWRCGARYCDHRSAVAA